MQAIHTKTLHPTNNRGTRVKAYTSTGFQVIVPWDYALDTLENHYKAAQAMVDKRGLDWDVSTMAYGDSADNRGYSFVFPHSIIGS
jgi:hypothetical protein